MVLVSVNSKTQNLSKANQSPLIPWFALLEIYVKLKNISLVQKQPTF